MIGFVRNTLNALRCDVVMGVAVGDDLVQTTNPYYHTTYALVFRPGSGLDGIESLEDPRLKGKHIGVVAGTPPATVMVQQGLMMLAKPYPLTVDTRVECAGAVDGRRYRAGQIDAGVLWGPIAGYYAQRVTPHLVVVPLLKEQERMDFRIAMGVRRTDQDWKRQLNRLIAENQPEIDRILAEYGVPLLDEQGKLIGAMRRAVRLRLRIRHRAAASRRGAGRAARAGRLSHGRLSRADTGHVARAQRCCPPTKRACALGDSTTRCSSMCCRRRRVRPDCRPRRSGATSRATTYPAASGCPTPATGALAPVMEHYFEHGLEQASGGDREPPAGVLLSGELLDVMERGEARAGGRLSPRRLVSGRHRWLGGERPAAGAAHAPATATGVGVTRFTAARPGWCAPAQTTCSILPGTSQA